MMEKLYFLLLSILIIYACSPVLFEPALDESPMLSYEGDVPSTKSSLENQEEIGDEPMRLHIAQTDHRLILMHHVEFRDSLYVQTLTVEDMTNMNFSDEERDFSDKYVVGMNELLKLNAGEY